MQAIWQHSTQCERCMAVLQDDTSRLLRLRRAQEDFQLTDEHAGAGQQGNSLLALQRDERLSSRSRGNTQQTMAAAAAATTGPAAVAPAEGDRPSSAQPPAAAAAGSAAAGEAAQDGSAEVRGPLLPAGRLHYHMVCSRCVCCSQSMQPSCPTWCGPGWSCSCIPLTNQWHTRFTSMLECT